VLLTSFDRVLRYLSSANVGATSLTDTQNNRRDILGWIQAASKLAETYCNRSFATEARAEYFDVNAGQREFHVKAPPITTLTSAYLDSTGKYDGSETELTDAFISARSYSVITDDIQTLGVQAKKGVRIIYTGGLAVHGVQSIFTLTGITGTWTVGKYAMGGTSLACGIVRAFATPALTVEVLYGEFATAETLTEYDSETAQGSSDGSGVLSAKTQTALCEAYPDIVRAVEIQVAHYYRYRSSFELSGTNRDGTSLRRQSAPTYMLEPEAESLLQPYRRWTV
jgi:hypothetical protein